MEALFEKFQIYWKNNGFEEEFDTILKTKISNDPYEKDARFTLFLEKHFNQFCLINDIEISNIDLIRLIIINCFNVKNALIG